MYDISNEIITNDCYYTSFGFCPLKHRKKNLKMSILNIMLLENNEGTGFNDHGGTVIELQLYVGHQNRFQPKHVPTHCSVSVVLLVVVVGTDGDLRQEHRYVGERANPLFVLHSETQKRGTCRLRSWFGSMLREKRWSNSQFSHVMVANVVLLQPRPLIKLQVLYVLHHLGQHGGEHVFIRS